MGGRGAQLAAVAGVLEVVAVPALVAELLVVAELAVVVVVLEAAVPSSPRWWSRWPACARWSRT